MISKEEVQKHFGNNIITALRHLDSETLVEVADFMDVFIDKEDGDPSEYIEDIAEALENEPDLNSQELEDFGSELAMAVDNYQYMCGVNHGKIGIDADMQLKIARDLNALEGSSKEFSKELEKFYNDLWWMGFLTEESKKLLGNLVRSNDQVTDDLLALAKHYDQYLTKWAYNKVEKKKN